MFAYGERDDFTGLDFREQSRDRQLIRHLFMTSLRTSPDALLRLIRQCWSIENEWHWARDAGLTKSPVEAGDQGACPSADPSSFVPSQDGPRSSAPFAGPQLDLEAALPRWPVAAGQK